MSNVESILEIGRKVDVVIDSFLLRGASSEFKPILKYPIEMGGKRVRASLALLCCKATGGTFKEGLVTAAIAELIHNYSLLLDDVIDRGELRRGKPTVRVLYTDAMALLAAMYYREVIEELIFASNDRVAVERLVVETIKDLIEGERLDILFEQAGRKGKYIESARRREIALRDYFTMIGKKTASLISASCKFGCIASRAPPAHKESLTAFGWNIGLTFQIIDDYLDIFGEKTGKERGKDIKEHKLGNAAILIALDELEEHDEMELLKILSKEVVSTVALQKALKIIGKTDSKNRTIELGRRYLDKGLENLQVLPDSKAKTMLEELANFIVSRLY